MFIRNSSRTLLGTWATPTGSIFDTPLDKAELESRGSTSLTMLEGKAVIGETDMFRAMQQYALDLASKALDDYDVTEATDIARFIKQEFDRTYGPGWQCIVGTDFGSFVTHRFGCFIYFCIGSLAILLFRASAGAEAPDANQFATTLESVKA